MHGVENCLDDRFITHGRIDHHVIQGTGGPVRVKVMLHVGNAFAIDSIDEAFRF